MRFSILHTCVLIAATFACHTNLRATTLTDSQPFAAVAGSAGLSSNAIASNSVATSDDELFTVNSDPKSDTFIGSPISAFDVDESQPQQDRVDPLGTAPSECAIFLFGGSLLTLFGARRPLFPIFSSQ